MMTSVGPKQGVRPTGCAGAETVQVRRSLGRLALERRGERERPQWKTAWVGCLGFVALLLK
jgi:hypothetical protein